MISLRTTAVLLVGLLSGSALAQGMGEASPDSPVIAGLAGLHQMTSANLVATAETLDEEMYAFRPTEEVRTAGQILAHVANAQYMFCSAAAKVAWPKCQRSVAGVVVFVRSRKCEMQNVNCDLRIKKCKMLYLK